MCAFTICTCTGKDWCFMQKNQYVWRTLSRKGFDMLKESNGNLHGWRPMTRGLESVTHIKEVIVLSFASN